MISSLPCPCTRTRPAEHIPLGQRHVGTKCSDGEILSSPRLPQEILKRLFHLHSGLKQEFVESDEKQLLLVVKNHFVLAHRSALSKAKTQPICGAT